MIDSDGEVPAKVRKFLGCAQRRVPGRQCVRVQVPEALLRLPLPFPPS